MLSSHIRVIANKREAGEVAISLYTAHSAPREPVQRRPQGRHAPTGAHERRYTPMFQSTFIPVGDSLSARTASAGLGRATSCAPLRAGLRAGVLALAVSLGGLTVSSTVSAAEPRRILGGLGFSTIFDINRKRAFKKFRLNTKIILITTAILIVIPTFLFFIFEMNNPKTLGNMNLGEKILASLFQVVSPRTAGYNTIELSQMYDSTKFLTIILMFIGGAPASTAGGLKITTFTLIIISVYCLFKQKSEIEIFGRTIPFKNLNKALVSLVIGFTLVITGTMIILSYSDFDFLTVLYEVTSAYATVGLTLGITTKLNAVCKITLIILMFMGRVGSLTDYEIGRASCRERV